MLGELSIFKTNGSPKPLLFYVIRLVIIYKKCPLVRTGSSHYNNVLHRKSIAYNITCTNTV